jgi:ubiquinone/menaquinone biosynthesis C-methylase UbiE
MKPLDKREVRENYDNLGGRLYNLRYEEEQSRKYSAALKLTCPRREDLLLDDGCGTGMFFSHINSPCVGLDLSGNLLAVAKDKLKPNHYLVHGDSEHLPFRRSVFNEVYAVTLIQNLPDKVLAVSEMKRVSRTQATLLVTALKAAFNREYLAGLLEGNGFSCAEIVDDIDTNDWIARAKA